jgi:2-oxoglutarate dehydrogenase E1 component
MGPWPFVHQRLHRLLRDSHQLRHIARAESASPATGSSAIHEQEQADLMERAVAGLEREEAEPEQVAASSQAVG